MLPLGTGDGIKRDEFSENFRRGGRDIISIKKLILQLLDL